MIRALITDFGGVLVRTRADQSRRELERRLGLPLHSLEDRIFSGDLSQRAQRGEIAEEDFWRQVEQELKLNRYGLTGPEFRRGFFADDFLDGELVDLLRSVRPAIKTGLISNAWSGLRPVLQNTFAIDDAFDQIVVSAEEKVMKPDARIYRIALDRLDVQPDQAIFLDDVLANVEAANALGMFGIHFRSSQQARSEIRARLDGPVAPPQPDPAGRQPSTILNPKSEKW